MSQGPPPSGPPPAGPPPAGPPPSGPRPPQRQAGRARVVVVAAIAGLVVGVGGGVAATLALAGDDDDDDVALACAALDDVSTDELFDRDGIDGEVYRLGGASELFLAAGDGDPDTETGRIGTALRRGFQTLNEEELERAVDDATTFCDDR